MHSIQSSRIKISIEIISELLAQASMNFNSIKKKINIFENKMDNDCVIIVRGINIQFQEIFYLAFRINNNDTIILYTKTYSFDIYSLICLFFSYLAHFSMCQRNNMNGSQHYNYQKHLYYNTHYKRSITVAKQTNLNALRRKQKNMNEMFLIVIFTSS